VSFQAAISACEKGMRPAQALKLLKEMHRRALEAGTVAYNAAISACEKGGRWVRAMSLLDELGWRGVHPDTITYNAAASACEKRSCWLPALEILSQAPEPNSLTFAAAIAAVSTEGHRWALVLGLSGTELRNCRAAILPVIQILVARRPISDSSLYLAVSLPEDFAYCGLSDLNVKHLNNRIRSQQQSMTSDASAYTWGYFGVAGSLSIGDNSYGSAQDVYFSFALPLAIGDPYVEPGASMKKGRVVMLDPDARFKPPGTIQEPANKGMEYVPHCDSMKDPKAVKEKFMEYAVPRQIYTNPIKKGGGGVLTGGVIFGFGEPGKFPEHMPDDYDSARKDRIKDLEEHHKKCQEAPFKGIAYGNQNFQTNTDAYGGYEVPTHIPREPMPDLTKKYPHEAPFRPANPSKKGMVGALLGGIPEHLPDPGKGPATRKPVDENAPPAFKLGGPML
ncbi:unnamed protein product, partial [Polarella glacialis]